MKALTWKLVILTGVTVLLLIVLTRIGWLVSERQERQRGAEAGVAAAQAGPQVLLGPIVQRQCTEEWKALDKDLTLTPQRRDFVLSAMPTELSIDGALAQEPRYRGLFKINAYAGKVAVDAVFTSEAYGPGFAAYLAGALARPVRHVAVDPTRARVPGSMRSGKSSRANIRASVNHLRHGSRLLENLIQKNGLLVVGAEYSLETGAVDFFDHLPAEG